MRVGLVHKRLDASGGTERDFYQTAVGLRDRGHEIHLFCGEFGLPIPSGITGHTVPVVRLGRTAELWTFANAARRLLAELPCDVVISFCRTFYQDVVRCGGGTHRGFLTQMAERSSAGRRCWQWINPYHRSVLAIEARQFQPAACRKVIAVSEVVKRDIVTQYQVDERDIEVLYNGVDLDRFKPGRASVGSEVRRSWDIPRHAPLVLFVGSGFRRKGLDRLMRLWRQPQLENCYLLVVGGDARIRFYQTEARAIGGNRIVFTGRQEQVEKFYAAADAVALPSIQEAFGNVVLEALASGLPILLSRGVGGAELLHGDLLQGVVEKPDDGDELMQKLLHILNPERREQLSSQARKIAEGCSWSKHFDALEAILGKTSQSKSSAAHVS